MPTGDEKVVNKALSGAELKQLIVADCAKLIANEGLLSDYLAYGRVGYDITLRLHMDNPMNAESTITTPGRGPGLEPAPLANPSGQAAVSSTTLSRKIDSPNAERLRAGMPIPVQVKQQDGTITMEQVSYPASDDLEGNVKIEDTSAEAKHVWRL